ncbi:hypothetical protein HZA57_01510 [Candidatus Poribacteria bacterium]|nr:hypothetical protein [Candidatus Poribacteria bacterium]
MPEASTRVLLDRTTLRLDGHPFFAFGVNLFLTPAEVIPGVMRDLARAGFTAVMTPPISPGNVPSASAIFEAAEQNNMLVILRADPRVPNVSTFLASRFKHRPGLHSYYLPTADTTAAAFDQFCRERDRLRAYDLFHPIWTSYRPEYPLARWIDSVDIHAVPQGTGGPRPRLLEENGGELLRRVVEECARTSVGRPLFCHALQVGIADSARESGLYDFDPWVRSLPRRMLDWFPFLANLPELPRWDFLGPESDLLRVRLYELLAGRVRGVIAETYEFLQGPQPFTGRDRFCELACLAQEVAVFREFFSEGQLVRAELETGHPRLRGAMLHHGDDILVMLWRSAEGDEYWIDPSTMNRVEVSIALNAPMTTNAWRMDFPAARPLEIVRDLKGAIRIDLDMVDLTALVLITRGTQRAKDLATALQRRLPTVARYAVEGVEHRLTKIMFIENELLTMKAGQNQQQRLLDCHDLIEDAKKFLRLDEFADACAMAWQAGRLLRTIVNRQMVEALASSNVERDSREDMLRRSYFTLPQFFKERATQTAVSLMEFT